MSIGNNIKKARKAKGLTQSELAIACGWVGDRQQGKISHYETGRREPPLNMLDIIAKALGVDITDLLESSPNFGASPPLAQSVPLLQWAQLNDRQSSSIDNWIACPIPYNTNVFAVIIDDESMTAIDGRQSYPTGAILFIDPTIEPRNTDKVIAKSTVSNKFIFRILIEDFDTKSLHALNPQYNPIQLSTDIEVIGVVKGTFKSE